METRMIEAKVYPNQKSPALFRNPFLEKLTRTHPMLITAMYLLIGAAMIYYYLTQISNNWWAVVGYFFAGLFTWTFLEYILHRFLYHSARDGSYDRGFHYTFHGIHHEYPNDRNRLVLPPIPSLIIASIVFLLLYLPFGTRAFLLAPGIMTGYLIYMNIHVMVHKYAMPSRFNFWWKHHSIHHFQQHDRAFGVSSPLWDYIFGTMPEKNRRTVVIKRPEKS